MIDDKIFRVYVKLLKWHQKRHATWEPIPSYRIRLGSVGYFDVRGRWEEVLPHVTSAPPVIQFIKEFENILESTDTRQASRT